MTGLGRPCNCEAGHAKTSRARRPPGSPSGHLVTAFFVTVIRVRYPSTWVAIECGAWLSFSAAGVAHLRPSHTCSLHLREQRNTETLET